MSYSAAARRTPLPQRHQPAALDGLLLPRPRQGARRARHRRLERRLLRRPRRGDGRCRAGHRHRDLLQLQPRPRRPAPARRVGHRLARGGPGRPAARRRHDAAPAARRRRSSTPPNWPRRRELALRAAEACTRHARPLYAAHADLPVPEQPHLAYWHAATLLREHRGDGHLAALLAAGLDPVEALVSHTATGKGMSPRWVLATRGWRRTDWDDATERLRGRGLLDAEGELTEAGVALRAELEDAHRPDRRGTVRASRRGGRGAADRAGARLPVHGGFGGCVPGRPHRQGLSRRPVDKRGGRATRRPATRHNAGEGATACPGPR